jgi:transcriptional regulator of acetoin/glycerol metabolism
MNVRELEQTLRAACAIAAGDDLELAHLPEELQAPPALEVGDREAFLEVVRAHQAKVSAIARALSTSRSQVRRLAKRYGVDLAVERGD